MRIEEPLPDPHYLRRHLARIRRRQHRGPRHVFQTVEMASPLYLWMRARALDGSLPGDSHTGSWVTSTMRVLAGWGSVPEESWPYEEALKDWPPHEPPGLDEVAKSQRIATYQRVRSVDEATVAIAMGSPVNLGLRIDPSWNTSGDGHVGGQLPDGRMHAIAVIGYDNDTQLFEFANSWGEAWGDDGYGFFSFDYFTERLVEAYTWGAFPTPDCTGPGLMQGSFCCSDIQGGILRAHEIIDGPANERVGWCFIVERDGFADIEELFIRPEYRGRGLGRRLAISALATSVELDKPLRLWISHADGNSATGHAGGRILRKLGLRAGLSPHPWAAFLATRP
jgi:GNAT superfamily N-acetyltransferase